jgi:hypothetical protein
MAGLMIFAAGAVSGVLAGCVVRNRGVICKALELPEAIKQKIGHACNFGREHAKRLISQAPGSVPTDS